MREAREFRNRLLQEASPYLRQHGHNPVDWYPWGEEAFARAKAEKKPIFLSVGYSTCHWCHVMERESFENEGIAKFLNEHFVSIKVDREERPDVDHIYMSAVQAMSGAGGWPMSVFLTPDLRPFYAGTYFPPTPAYGRPSFQQLIVRIAELWQNERDALVESSFTLTNAISVTETKTDASHTAPEITSIARSAHDYFKSVYDRFYGGFGSAPKFPRPVQFDFLFQYWFQTGEAISRDMALETLRRIVRGGIHDHVGGGFHRYSVDKEWKVSHFEKMLYDQAQLINSLVDAFQITHDKEFQDAALDTIAYLSRDMSEPSGGFYSAEDADSEGVEGKYYVWKASELREIIGDGYDLFARHFSITEEGNFENGENVLHATKRMTGEARSQLSEALQKLFDVRNTRVRPGLDDKILTSWNGLAISAFARVGRTFDKPEILSRAESAAEFVWTELRKEKLLHRWHQGSAAIHAYLEDYAFLIKGYLDLYHATWNNLWRERAAQLQSEQDARLWHDGQGAYFMAGDGSDLIFRPKTEYDGAEPAGNSIAALNLLRLSRYTGESKYRDRFQSLLRYFLPRLESAPFAMPEFLVSAIQSSEPDMQVVLVGTHEERDQYQREVDTRYLPGLSLFDARSALDTEGMNFDRPGAYVCKNFTCELPVHTSAELATLLQQLIPTE